MHTWQLQEAKAKLSELVKKAQAEGPQAITVHGKPAAVVLSQEEFERLAKSAASSETRRRSIHDMSLSEFLLNSPLAGADLDIERDKDPGREIDLE